MLGPILFVLAIAIVAVPLLFALEAAVFALVRRHLMGHPYFNVVGAPLGQLHLVETTTRVVENRLGLEREHARGKRWKAHAPAGLRTSLRHRRQVTVVPARKAPTFDPARRSVGGRSQSHKPLSRFEFRQPNRTTGHRSSE